MKYKRSEFLRIRKAEGGRVKYWFYRKNIAIRSLGVDDD